MSWLKLVFSVALLTSSSLSYAAELGTLTLRIKDIPDAQGHIAYAVFSSARGFPDEPSLAIKRGYEAISTSHEVMLSIPNLTYGEYAVSLYQDRNDDHELNKNFFGIPTEPIGFSKNPSVKYGPPKFEQARFSVQAPVVVAEIHMLH